MKKHRNEAAVGMFVVIGFIILTLIVFFVSGVYFFRSGYAVTAVYDYVSILDKGAPVRMAGVRVGEVSSVALKEDAGASKTRVWVKLFIEKGVQIRENYVFTIRGTHVLSEPHIEISPQPGGVGFLKDGAVVEGANLVPLEALIERAHSIAENLDAIFRTFRDAVDDEESAKALKTVLVNLAKITESLETVLTGSEKDLKQAIHNIESSTASMDRIMTDMDKGEGTMGKLLNNDELYEEMRAFVTEIKTHPWRLLKKK